MFIFVLLFIGFIIWACSSDDNKASSQPQTPVVRSSSTSTTTVRSANYSRPQTTVAVKPRVSTTKQTTGVKSAVSGCKSNAVGSVNAVYVPRATLKIDVLRSDATVVNPRVAEILSRPAVSVVGDTIPNENKPKSVTKVKPEHQEILRTLKENGVVHLYHFTDRRNLESIRRNGGLFSWQTCMNKGIQIPFAGGDGSSRLLDTRYGLQDYVRLSLCDDHPMMWRLKQNGYDLVLLKIKIDAALLRDTLYSDMNATDGQHSHGGTLRDLKKIRFSATKRRYVRRDDADFKYHQAEVMVKTFIPAEYIVNLDYPQAA